MKDEHVQKNTDYWKSELKEIVITIWFKTGGIANYLKNIHSLPFFYSLPPFIIIPHDNPPPSLILKKIHPSCISFSHLSLNFSNFSLSWEKKLLPLFITPTSRSPPLLSSSLLFISFLCIGEVWPWKLGGNPLVWCLKEACKVAWSILDPHLFSHSLLETTPYCHIWVKILQNFQ